MRFLKCMVLLLAFAAAIGIGVYMCTDYQKTERVEEAVLI